MIYVHGFQDIWCELDNIVDNNAHYLSTILYVVLTIIPIFGRFYVTYFYFWKIPAVAFKRLEALDGQAG